MGIGLLIPDGHSKTVRFVIDDWSNSSWGIHRIRRTVSTCEVSVAGDGSRNNDCEYRGFRHFLIPEEKPYRERHLYLRIPHQLWSENKNTGEIHGGNCECSWTIQQNLTPQFADPDCSIHAREILHDKSTRRAKWEGADAGHRVITYTTDPPEDSGSPVEEMSFAPDLNCTILESRTTWPGSFGIPGARWHYRVLDYRRGDPDPAKFQIPQPRR